jgi:hypothetical protein
MPRSVISFAVAGMPLRDRLGFRMTRRSSGNMVKMPVLTPAAACQPILRCYEGSTSADKKSSEWNIFARLARLGFRNVKTYVQSGNIVFRATKQPPSALSKRISEAILHDFGFSLPALVKTSKEMEDMIKSNPLLKEKRIDASKLHVTFLSGP